MVPTSSMAPWKAQAVSECMSCGVISSKHTFWFLASGMMKLS